MARTPSKQLERIVMKHNDSGFIPSDTVLQLLSRQHAKFVQLVKKRTITDVEGDWDKGHNTAIKDILAALQQGGKR